MKLSKRDDSFVSKFTKTEPEYKKALPVDWSRYEICHENIIPFGKYQGKTVSFVKNTDDWYMNWMHEQNIWADWKLLKEKKHKTSKNKDYDPFITSDGTVWLCIYEIPIKKDISRESDSVDVLM